MPISSGAEEDDQVRLARAYNTSIYLMVGMPYALLGGVGYLVYRGLRQKARLEAAAGVGLDRDPLPGGAPCLPTSSPPCRGAGS